MICPLHDSEMELRTKSELAVITTSHFWCGKCKTVYRVRESCQETLIEKHIHDDILGQIWVKI